MQTPSYTVASVECPRCGKHSIVSHQEGLYHCLNCDAEWNLNGPSAQEAAGGNPIAVFFGVAVFILTLLLFI